MKSRFFSVFVVLFLSTTFMACQKTESTAAKPAEKEAEAPSANGPKPAQATADEAQVEDVEPSPTPVADPPNALPEAVPTAEAPPPAAPENGGPAAWLAWRQGVDGVPTTALLFADEPSGAGEATDSIVLKGTLLLGAGEQFVELSPEIERWSLQPCGDPAEGVARSLRLRTLSFSASGPAYGEAQVKKVSAVPRPAEGDSAFHDEYLAFPAQLGARLLVRHVTVSDVCPVPGAGSSMWSDQVLELGSLELGAQLSVFPEAELATLSAAGLKTASERIAERHGLSAEEVAPVLALQGWEGAWAADGVFQMSLKYGGSSAIFGEDPSGGEGYEQELVELRPLPAALGEVSTAPQVVQGFWLSERAADEGKAVNGNELDLYDGVGWSRVPSVLVGSLKAEFEQRLLQPGPWL